MKQDFFISEGIDYDPADTYLKAFWVGVMNTIRVKVSSVLSVQHYSDFFFGIARLSSNWLVRKIATIYVECFS